MVARATETRRHSVLSRPSSETWVSVAAWASRIGSAPLNFITLALAANYLGASGYGQIAVLAGASTWFAFVDLGFATTLQNELSRRRGLGLPVDEVVAGALGLTTAILVVGLPVMLGWGWLAPAAVLAGKSEFSGATLIALAFITGLSAWLSAAAQISVRLLIALGAGRTPYGILFVSAVVSFGLMQWVIATGQPLSPLVICAILYLAPAVGTGVNIVLLMHRFPSFRDALRARFELLRGLWPKARKFLLFFLLGSIVLQLDYIVLGRLVASDEVAQYSFASKIVHFATVLYLLSLCVLWPRCSELIAQKRPEAVRALVQPYLRWGMVVLAGIVAVVALYRNELFPVLGVPLEAVPSALLVVSVGIYSVIRIWTDTFAMILQASGHIDVLLRIVPVQAVISIFCQVGLCQRYGVAGVPAGVAISFILTVAWYLPYKVSHYEGAGSHG